MKNIILSIFVCFLCFSANTYGCDTVVIEDTKYAVLVNNYLYSKNKKQNAALVIDGELELTSLKKLYNNELIREYTLGDDYQLYFFDENDNLLYTRELYPDNNFFSNSYAEIVNLLDKLFNQIRIRPSHYIYNLELEVGIAPSSVSNALSREDVKLVLLGNEQLQYPSMKLVYGEPLSQSAFLKDAEYNFRNLEKQFELESSVIDTSNVYSSTKRDLSISDSLMNIVSRQYFFRSRTDLDIAMNKVVNSNQKNLFVKSCSPIYYVQLLSEDSNIDRIIEKLKKYSFFRSLVPAEKGFVYENCILDYSYYDEK